MTTSDRSPESYEREIRSLSQALSNECANSYRLAQEVRELREALDAVALREHTAAHPTPPTGPPPLSSKTTLFQKPDGSPLIELTVKHAFSKITSLAGKLRESQGLPKCPFCGGELCAVVLADDVGGGPGVSCGGCGAYTSRLPWRVPWLYEGRSS